MTDILVRELTQSDVEAIMPLMIQLGYEVNIDELQRRFTQLTDTAGHHVFGAENEGELVGFCHVFARPALEKPPEAIVQALVVTASQRSSGIGGRLMEAVEDWSYRQGYRSVALYSQVERKDAHAFYSGLGYATVTTSSLLRKILDDRSAEG